MNQTTDALQRSMNAQQVILSTKGHINLEEAASIIDTALDAGRPEVYQLITSLAVIAADALAASNPTGWVHQQERLIIGAQLLQLENTPAELMEPPC